MMAASRKQEFTADEIIAFPAFGLPRLARPSKPPAVYQTPRRNAKLIRRCAGDWLRHHDHSAMVC
jgi:hypothetical protein